jgi:hypothetical protein
MRRPAAKHVLVCTLPLFALAGCGIFDSGADDTPLVFEGAIQGVPTGSTASGTAVAVTQLGQTEMGLSVQGLEPETTHHWYLRQGDCNQSGDPVVEPAIFPTFVTSEEGAGESLRIISQRLRGQDRYSIPIMDGPVGEGTVLACATLARVQ